MSVKAKNRESYIKWYTEHKDELKIINNVPHVCDVCGGKYTHVNRTHHLRSRKHTYALQKKNELEVLQKELDAQKQKNIVIS